MLDFWFFVSDTGFYFFGFSYFRIVGYLMKQSYSFWFQLPGCFGKEALGVGQKAKFKGRKKSTIH